MFKNSLFILISMLLVSCTGETNSINNQTINIEKFKVVNYNRQMQELLRINNIHLGSDTLIVFNSGNCASCIKEPAQNIILEQDKKYYLLLVFNSNDLSYFKTEMKHTRIISVDSLHVPDTNLQFNKPYKFFLNKNGEMKSERLF